MAKGKKHTLPSFVIKGLGINILESYPFSFQISKCFKES